MRGHSRLATVFGATLAVGLLYALPAVAQRGDQRPAEQRPVERPRANQGHVPPPPQVRGNHAEVREPERLPTGHVNEIPHVNHDRWYGHEAPNDTRFHLATPWARGRFDRVGPSYRYGVQRVDVNQHRFWIAGRGGFEVAAWEWPLAADWCWDCGDDFAVYDDPDHPGWYLLYNVHTGVYVHAQYIGT
jgi:hypothetical protein